GQVEGWQRPDRVVELREPAVPRQEAVLVDDDESGRRAIEAGDDLREGEGRHEGGSAPLHDFPDVDVEQFRSFAAETGQSLVSPTRGDHARYAGANGARGLCEP